MKDIFDTEDTCDIDSRVSSEIKKSKKFQQFRENTCNILNLFVLADEEGYIWLTIDQVTVAYNRAYYFKTRKQVASKLHNMTLKNSQLLENVGRGLYRPSSKGWDFIAKGFTS